MSAAPRPPSPRTMNAGMRILTGSPARASHHATASRRLRRTAATSTGILRRNHMPEFCLDEAAR